MDRVGRGKEGCDSMDLWDVLGMECEGIYLKGSDLECLCAHEQGPEGMLWCG